MVSVIQHIGLRSITLQRVIRQFQVTCPVRSLSTTHKKYAGQQLNLSGVFPPIPTPFNQDETIAYDKLQTNLEKWNQLPFSGYLVQGSNGEMVFLSEEERVQMVECAREAIPRESGKILLAGSGCESTHSTISLTERMAKAGADAAVVVTPCYYKGGMKDEAMYAHYKMIADNSPIPVILYSVPANTAIDLSVDVAKKLADHPNIIGMKDSGGDITKIGSLVHQTKGKDFQVLAGSASFLLASMHLGCVGGVCALANVLGEATCQLHQLYSEGSIKEAAVLQHKLIAPNIAVTRGFGIPGLKQTMDWVGLYGGPTRSPLQPLSPADTEKLRSIFVKAGYIA